MLKYLFLLLVPLISLFTGRVLKEFRHTVPEGYVAVKRCMGRIVIKKGVPAIYKGGYVWCLPGIHSLEIYHETNNPIETEAKAVDMSDGVYSVSGSIVFGITDMRAMALADTKHVSKILQNFATAVLSNTLRGKKAKQAYHSQKQLCDRLQALMSPYGVGIHQFIPVLEPTDVTAAALVMTTRAVKIKNACQILDVDIEDADSSALIAAIAGQSFTHTLSGSPAKSKKVEATAEPESGLGQIFDIASQPRR